MSNTPQHTPGPWRLWQPSFVVEGANGEPVDEGPSGSLVLDGDNERVFIADFDANNPTSVANARLCAAAPDLLVALKRAANAVAAASSHVPPTMNKQMDLAWSTAQDAIAKASPSPAPSPTEER